ncbi:hypothetical protein PFISCL1PPCAC_5567, partial [Pristionchus fissidentatus]
MAASLAKDAKANRQGCVQMLLAVQNVAVENLAIALKAFDDGKLRPYRILSKMRIDPNDPIPYDIFEMLPHYKRWMQNANDQDLLVISKYFRLEKEWRATSSPDCQLNQKDKDDLNRDYPLAIYAAKRVLERYMQPEIVLATVDMALYRLLDVAEDGVRGQFWDVDRVIIDEASLLTESTFYCLIRCFPKASFVLIGDDKQLPPFMYDDHVLGHELAGRAALSVAMRKRNVPIIQLIEVYRAPQCLVEPYNHLSYDGELVSRKVEKCRPLFDVGLVSATRPDLLLIDVPKGTQKGHPSPFNEHEIGFVIRLLRLFPKSMHDDIMIICLYKEQKKRLQRKLGPDYDILTVDSSQGKEKPIVIVLTSRSDKVTDFFCNPNRCTVAVSRHQRSLIVVGNHALLSHHHPWKKVLDDFTKISPDSLPPHEIEQIGVKKATKMEKMMTTPDSTKEKSVNVKKEEKKKGSGEGGKEEIKTKKKRTRTKKKKTAQVTPQVPNKSSVPLKIASAPPKMPVLSQSQPLTSNPVSAPSVPKPKQAPTVPKSKQVPTVPKSKNAPTVPKAKQAPTVPK